MIIGNLCQCGNLKRGADTMMCRDCYELLLKVRGEDEVPSPAVRKPIPVPKDPKPVHDTCVCGGQKRIRAKRCWACHIKARKEASIPKRYCSCGKEIRHHNKSGMCKTCYRAWKRTTRNQQVTCGCGKKKHPTAEVCASCYKAGRRPPSARERVRRRCLMSASVGTAASR